MKVVNISDSTLNLESGACEPGATADVTDLEFKFLSAQDRVEKFVPKAVSKHAPKKLGK